MPLLGAAKTVSSMVDAFLNHKSSLIQASTLSSIENSLQLLVDEVGAMLVQSVERHHLDAIRDGLRVASSTQAKFSKDWRAFFAWCIEQNASTHNPADHLSTHVHAAKKPFISRETITQALMHCEDRHLAAVVALSRYGGLRIPSELYTLSSDDLQSDRILITDSKRHRTRYIPIFPELKDHLGAIYNLGSSTIVGLSPSGITSRFEQLLSKAQLSPWPKLWHSMRASRETELIRDYGITTACLWIGNSPSVAAKHYAQVSPEDWSRATQPSDNSHL
jgi:integrase